MLAWNASGATESTSLVMEFESATASKPPFGKVSSFEARTVLIASQAGASASSGKLRLEQPVRRIVPADITASFLSSILFLLWQ
jgi:hypothetical protein